MSEQSPAPDLGDSTIPPSPSKASSSQPKSPWCNVNSIKGSQPPRFPTSSEVINGIQASIPAGILEDVQPLWTNFLVGHFIEEAPHIGKVHATVNRLRTSQTKASKIDAQFINQKTVLFKIENGETRTRVLCRQFWHVADVPMVMQEWSPITSSKKPDLSSMPIWVDFKKVPNHLFSHKGLFFLGDLIGNAQKLHPNTEMYPFGRGPSISGCQHGEAPAGQNLPPIGPRDSRRCQLPMASPSLLNLQDLGSCRKRM